MNRHAQPAVVDVIIPVHNRSHLIRVCLDSVRAQSLQPDTVIVVDDGSTDETPAVLADYARGWSRLRVIRSEHRGAAHARNIGLAAARAQFVAFLDSDDIWDPSKLERQVALFAGRPELGVVHCACFQIDETGERLAGAPGFAPSKRGRIFEAMINTLYHLAGSASGVVARRDLVMSVGGFDESLFHVEDQDLWLKLARVSMVDYVPEALVGLRSHNGSRFAARLKSDPAFALLQHVTVWNKWIHVADEAAILQAFRRKLFFLNRTSLFRLISHYRAYRTFKTSNVALARRLFRDFRSYLRCMIAADMVAGTLHQRTKFAFAAKLILPNSLRLQFEQAVGKFRMSSTKGTSGGAGASAEASIGMLDATIAAYAATIGLEKFVLVGNHSAEYDAQSGAERDIYQQTGRPVLTLMERESRPRIRAPFHWFGHVICTQPQLLDGIYWCMDLIAAGYFYAHFHTQQGARRFALPAQLTRNLLTRLGLRTAFSAALAPQGFPQRRPRRYQPASGRVLMLSAEFVQGGAERRMFNTAAGLVRRGYDVQMIAFNESAPKVPTFAQEFGRLGIAAQTLPALTDEPRAADFAVLNNRHYFGEMPRFPQWFADLVCRVAGAIENHRPWVVHGWLDKPGLISALAAVELGVPRIVISFASMPLTHHNVAFPSFLKPAYAAVVRHPNVIVLNNSAAGAKGYERWIGLRKGSIRIIRNAFLHDYMPAPQPHEVAEFRAGLGVDPKQPLVGTLMRLCPQKDPALWLATAAEIARARPDVVFRIWGQGPLENEIESRVEELGLRDRVRLAGHITTPGLAYAACDVVLLTSAVEGLPNTLIEAQAAGCPVVTTSVGGTGEALSDGVTGILVRQRSPRKLARAVLAILRDPSWRDRARRHGPDFIRQNFGFERMIDETIGVYNGERRVPAPDRLRICAASQS